MGRVNESLPIRWVKQLLARSLGNLESISYRTIKMTLFTHVANPDDLLHAALKILPDCVGLPLCIVVVLNKRDVVLSLDTAQLHYPSQPHTMQQGET